MRARAQRVHRSDGGTWLLRQPAGHAATTFINIDEVTTVGAVYALAPFMTGVQTLGSDASTARTNALAAAFASSKDHGRHLDRPGARHLDRQRHRPQTTINSLANSLAACINSASYNSTPCSNLFG